MLVARKMAPFIQKVMLWTAQHILHNLHYKVLDWERALLAVDPWNAAALHKLAEQILAGVTHKYGNVGFGMVISERLQAIYDELVGADASFAKVKKRSEKLAKKARRAAANPTSPDFPWDYTVPSMWVVPTQPAAAETGANVPRKPKDVSGSGHIKTIVSNAPNAQQQVTMPTAKQAYVGPKVAHRKRG
jgi:hypothetical protein